MRKIEIPERLKALTLSQIADALQVTEMRVRQEILAGRLKAARVGWCWRITPAELERYMTALAEAPAVAQPRTRKSGPIAEAT